MAGPSKKRATAEKQPSSSSGTQPPSGGANNQTQRSTPKAIPRLDGNRDPGASSGSGARAVDYSNEKDLKNISEFLGVAGWYTARGVERPSSLPRRPNEFNKYGKETNLTLNTYNVLQSPKSSIHQYDVSWGGETDATKRLLVKKIWNSKAVKAALGEPQNMWIYDGNKLAWCGIQMPRDELRIEVDLDAEEGRTSKPGKPNKHRVFIRHVRKIDIAHLNSFLSGQSTWSTECIDAINCIDHILREMPSRKYTKIKKSFFQRTDQRFDLGGGVEALKGVFSSLRPVLTERFEKSLAVNVDVANGTFWRSQELIKAICQMLNCNPHQFIQRVKDAKKDWKQSYIKKDLGRLKRVGVTAFHVKDKLTQWTIEEITKDDCHETKFNDPEDRDSSNPRRISVYQYFKSKYGIELTAGLPIVKMTKKIRKGPVYLPIEFLRIDVNQRYNAKLSDTQTSNMIKFAVTLPAQRRQAVDNGVRLLDWQNDPYLKNYMIKVNPNPTKVKARVLPSPAVGFGPQQAPTTVPERDLVQGRWRLDGKKFMGPNSNPIAAWGICVIQGRGAASKEGVDTFASKFVQIYEGHGGRFNPKMNKRPHIFPGNLSDGGELVAKAFNMTGNHFNSRPMFLMFVVNDRNIDVYRRIKKSCDCRFGIPSQVLQSKHVLAGSPQYISNVCMKVNAKLGGYTSATKSAVIPKVAAKALSLKTMVIGADVSHPAPGAGSDEKASFAAMTMSSDRTYTRYWAECQTNGNRVEMITAQNIHDHIGGMASKWINTLGNGSAPDRVLYIRDGVSEGQYQAVLEEEVRNMKETFKKLGVKKLPDFTVVIAGKRHHIRFFPDQGKGDRNGNPLPGTLVEAGCTHPFEFDFYLCSHVAIKGTARPIHYQCILNEGNWQAAELQSFLFEHSYQYVRSTTPVSLHPAVYYAHLAADRSRAHQNESPVSSGKKEAKPEQQSSTGNSTDKSVEVKPLMALGKAQNLSNFMWYI